MLSIIYSTCYKYNENSACKNNRGKCKQYWVHVGLLMVTANVQTFLDYFPANL